MRMMLLATVAFGLALCPSHAFEIDDFRSGMTVAEARAAVTPGLTMTLVKDKNDPTPRPFEVYWVTTNGGGIYYPYNLSFCDGRLVEVLKNFDFEADYIPTLREIIKIYGPRSWTGTKRLALQGGFFYETWTEWHSANDHDRVNIDYIPDQPNLNLKRSATVDYETRSHCSVNGWTDKDSG